jgi:hypothetical protein
LETDKSTHKKSRKQTVERKFNIDTEINPPRYYSMHHKQYSEVNALHQHKRRP